MNKVSMVDFLFAALAERRSSVVSLLFSLRPVSVLSVLFILYVFCDNSFSALLTFILIFSLSFWITVFARNCISWLIICFDTALDKIFKSPVENILVMSGLLISTASLLDSGKDITLFLSLWEFTGTRWSAVFGLSASRDSVIWS